MTEHAEKIVQVACAATIETDRPADAAALLIDAAAMCASEFDMTLDELQARLAHSFGLMVSANEAVSAIGPAAARRQ